MKAYKLEVMIIDFDEIGADNIKRELENARYANRCISPTVIDIQERDVGEWNDDHPLNSTLTSHAEFQRLFKHQNDVQIEISHDS